MRLSRTPDISGCRAMLLAALAVVLVVGGTMIVRDSSRLALALGDTDDATRLILVRGLVHGAGWYDQLLTRFSPPEGVYMHWSRLMDGGLYALNRLFALFTNDAQAETLMRMIWPLLWIFPAALATLFATRRFGSGAVFAGVVVLLTDGMLYAQFHPGRVDHHSAQIAFCMIALAGALQRGPRLAGALVAGSAIGVGLGVGLEALAFNILIGASFGLRFLIDQKEGRQVQAFGAALAGSSVAVFAVQTPPWRWSLAACDALAINTTVGLGLAGAGLVLAVWATGGRSVGLRAVAVGLVGALAAGAYLWLDPACIRGPFGEVDPGIRFWLSNVSEVLPITRIMRARPAEATELIASFVIAGGAWLWLAAWREYRRDLGFWLLGALLAAAMVTGLLAVRMENYAQWFAAPIVAVAAADIARRYAKEAMLATAVAALALSPVVAASASAYSYNRLFPPKAGRKTPKDFCFNTSSYRTLAKIGPPGLVLSDIDLGPFIVAHTPHSAVAAPYHRLSRGIVATRSILTAQADTEAERLTRALGVTYVLGCRAHGINVDRVGVKKDSLLRRLDAGKPPAWLERLSPDNYAIDVYRVRPAGAAPQSPSRPASASTGAQAGSKT